MYPYCSPNDSLSRSPDGHGDVTNDIDISKYIGTFYIVLGCITIPISCFVFSVISRPPLIGHACYKVMTWTTFLDIVNMISAMWICGVLSICKIHHCSYGIWIMYYSQFVMFFWYLYCSSSEVLALNRMLEFANKRLNSALFDGQRIYLWLPVVFGYSIVCTALVPDAFYHYDPYGGTFYFIRSSGDVNVVHLFNNFFKFGFMTTSYGLMLIFMFRLKKQSGPGTPMSNFQIKVSLQTLVIAVLADGVTLGYLASAYLPLSPEVAKYTGTFGQLTWISVHSGSGIIYLIMNKAVNTRFKRLFSNRPHPRTSNSIGPASPPRTAVSNPNAESRTNNA
ncbi:hypothetical protein QR680_006815 [Steinernema hermaphroditum]|uniref:Serpentine receptor class gamma n=1 Tax=Steinernema hermaphroditum TaxID=289476 RepID=A0AA39LY07_9BILA|nr:hypothetical protein QR680_006815 [Steinernema hermaphroditum]